MGISDEYPKGLFVKKCQKLYNKYINVFVDREHFPHKNAIHQYAAKIHLYACFFLPMPKTYRLQVPKLAWQNLKKPMMFGKKSGGLKTNEQ